jgi:hypothetical protein
MVFLGALANQLSAAKNLKRGSGFSFSFENCGTAIREKLRITAGNAGRKTLKQPDESDTGSFRLFDFSGYAEKRLTRLFRSCKEITNFR